MTHNRISTMDGLRGLAIFYVLLLHVTQAVPAKFYWGGFKSILLNGTFGVPLFFSISGYLVFSSLQKWYNSGVPRPLMAFFTRRIFRILPLWWITVVFYFLMDLIDLSSAIAYFTFFFGFDFNSYRTIYVSWSLFIEEIFYILLPVIFFKIQSIWSSLRLFAFLFIVAQFAHNFVPFSETNVLSYLHFFFMGILIYQIEQTNQLQEKIRQFSSRYNFIDLFALITLAMSFWSIWISRELAVPAIFLATMYGRGVLNLIANTKFYKLLGRMCFSLYLIHPLVLHYMTQLQVRVFESLNLVHSDGELQLAVWFPIIFFISLTISYLLFEFIEKPFIKLSDTMINKRSKV